METMVLRLTLHQLQPDYICFRYGHDPDNRWQPPKEWSVPE